MTKYELFVAAASMCITLTISNFAWQLVTKQDWSTAAERSFFQVAAIAAFSLVLGLRP